ncbi:hypothetical protein K437DRAFT_257767 [Tilletiaria anomala UBC 951]|uniref:Zn(2)-C6 fungal-type domain-containing protein n=1 Tax=Tilletiaria anomala (strain ATCC 24038 / CBS 436.72 / UBC 951) TaxID=1037660 RepID=A0A066VW08_TILAU|nr:uncharacterized protein K437DRAFT_257767 [Tilletiaria anomala UBC 951]KDN42740.1 hypothetical protein K437DRAFT_257767 [Tilletiaria anomala UBC 951]
MATVAQNPPPALQQHKQARPVSPTPTPALPLTAKKRTRPVSACEPCRAKKVRCLLPPHSIKCENCSATGKTCLFRVDDLAPKLRQERFANHGPRQMPSLGSAAHGAHVRAVDTGSALADDDDDADTFGDLANANSRKRKASSAASDDPPLQQQQNADASGKKKSKSKSVFRSFANPTNLAAPSPVPAAGLQLQQTLANSPYPQPQSQPQPQQQHPHPHHQNQLSQQHQHPHHLSHHRAGHANQSYPPHSQGQAYSPPSNAPRSSYPDAAAAPAVGAAGSASAYAYPSLSPPSDPLHTPHAQQASVLQPHAAPPYQTPFVGYPPPLHHQQEQDQQHHLSPVYQHTHAAHHPQHYHHVQQQQQHLHHAPHPHQHAGYAGVADPRPPSSAGAVSPTAIQGATSPYAPPEARRTPVLGIVGRERTASLASSGSGSQQQQALPSFRSQFPEIEQRGYPTAPTAATGPGVAAPGVNGYAHGAAADMGHATSRVQAHAQRAGPLPPPPNAGISPRAAAAMAAFHARHTSSSSPAMAAGPAGASGAYAESSHPAWTPVVPAATVPHAPAPGGEAGLSAAGAGAAAISRSQLYDTNPKVAAGMRWSSSAQQRIRTLSRMRSTNGATAADEQGQQQQKDAETFSPEYYGHPISAAAASAVSGGVFSAHLHQQQTSHVRDSQHAHASDGRSDHDGWRGAQRSSHEGSAADEHEERSRGRQGRSHTNGTATSGSDRDALTAPEDAPIGSSAVQAEILHRKLQSAAVNAARPSLKGKSLAFAGSAAGSDACDSPSGVATEKVMGSSGGGNGFKKIALPFFRWFGATANTPGYRRIKVGVFHDPVLEVDAPSMGATPAATTPAINAGSEAHSNAFTLAVSGTTPAMATGSACAGASAASLGRMYSKPRQEHAEGSPHKDVAHFGEASPRMGPGGGASGGSTLSTSTRELFEPSRPRYPRKDILAHLGAIFTSHFKSNFFPWLEADELAQGIQSGSLPALLANAICAMTARFSPRPELKRGQLKSAGEPFSDMAKTLIVPMLSWPSFEVIEALVLLSYAEFGAGSDSGLWMYAGMALRMAQDLGLQHESTISSLPDEKQATRARLLFWSVVGIDRIICFGTGRPVTIREDAINCDLPPLDEYASSEKALFGHIVRILLRRGAMGELLNRREDDISVDEKKSRLGQMWVELAQYYQTLPNALQFNVQTFKRAAAGNMGPAFVYLHVLFQSTISLLHRPALMRKFSAEMPWVLPEPSLAPIASSTSRTIADVLSLADALDEKSILANPYLDQLVLPAGRAFLGEREATREALKRAGYTPSHSRPPSRNGPVDTNTNINSTRNNLLLVNRSWAETNLATCQQVLDKLAVFWGGASWPARALEQESAGATEDVDPDACDDDAQNAPIHDVEMVLKWAKERVQQARAMTKSPTMRNKEQLPDDSAAANALFASGLGNRFSAQGFGISGIMGAEADLGMDALLRAWGMQTSGASTPFPRPAISLGLPQNGGNHGLPPVDFDTVQIEELLGSMDKDDVFPLNLPQEDFVTAAASSALFGPMIF